MNEHFSYLLQRYLDKHISEAELHQLSALLLESEDNEVFTASVEAQIRQTGSAARGLDVEYFKNAYDIESNDQIMNGIIEAILLADKKNNIAITTAVSKSAAISVPSDPHFQVSAPPIQRVHFLQSTWLKYAAAALIMLGSAAYLFINTRTDKELATKNGNKRLQTDIFPGSEQAILTLDGGRTIIIDSAVNGQLTSQSGVKVVKLANGQIVYQVADGENLNELKYNTLSNPRGSKVINIQLSDGSQVWLNAGSSVTFPVTFPGKERKVSITGEAYFEVAPDANKSFIVKKGNAEVQVLGTHFNINSFDDETDIKVTLLEGSVKVSDGTSSRMLQPGHQAVVAGTIDIVERVDMKAVMAWKDGYFNFNNADIKILMREIARWYDVEVVYEGMMPILRFGGEIPRTTSLTEAMEILRTSGVKFQLDGRKIIIRS